MIVAHKSEDNHFQSLEEHALGTALLAERFASVFGCGTLGYAAGLLHDLGKSSIGFQNRILYNGPKVEHSATGAKVMMDTKHLAGLLLAYCIAGHHSGLPDYGSSADTEDEATLHAKLKRERNSGANFMPFMHVTDPVKLLPASLPIRPLGSKSGGFSASMLIRMLYSCLVDADYLDTETFMSGNPADRDLGVLTEDIFDRFDDYISRKFSEPKREIDRHRCQIRNTCFEKAKNSPGLFSLTVPTGGGKTISSLSFALHHARIYNKSRIIYVIPYTSIIEQTAEVFRNILGNNAVLEHHSNVQYDDLNEEMNIARLASENWAAPVVVTTNVQFFESFFANRSSNCRKLHHVANSVIVFDETQMLPVPYLLPCLWVIAELVKNYHCTALMMSATKPALENYFPDNIKATEIIENIDELYTIFCRTQLCLLGEISKTELAQRLTGCKQVLCIVNSRKGAQELFAMLPEDEGSFHLSTLMPPVLRKDSLKKIRKRLEDNMTCRVVSTSLIEAGVDVDFPTVYREEAGLDSQIQAAGRCNREAKRKTADSIVYIYQSPRENGARIPLSLRLPIEVSRIIAQTYDDISSPQAIHDFFNIMYKNRGEGLDQKKIVELIESCSRVDFPFASISKEFRLIENATKTVFIPLNTEGIELAALLKSGKRNRALMRKAGAYQVAVYSKDFDSLAAAGALEYAKTLQNNRLIDDINFAILLNKEEWFSFQTGLKVPDLGIGLFV